eukprot:TRINITY_DN87950_c1_g1_i1.p1 TRINITY_DN87950_c1_g1~~TRINITY_DN87950_c1_g1_i1.p1  ORF type:complete len:595 (-),score=9.37 TRINITY_DN87950_c1_g1_i1:3368-5152(-)
MQRQNHMERYESPSSVRHLIRQLNSFHALGSLNQQINNIVYDILRSDDVPLVGLRKEFRNGMLQWKRFDRDPLSKEYLKALNTFDPSKVANLPTEEKRVWLYSKFDSMKDVAEKNLITLVVDRKILLRDSLEQFNTVTDLDLRREIKIHFVGEVGQDAGGVIREWFSELFEELFDPSAGLFQKANVPEVSYIINEHYKGGISHYYFCGQLLAKALFDRTPVKASLAKPILKQLLGQKVGVEDLKNFDLEIWKSVEFLRKHKIGKKEFVSTFTITKTEPDEVVTVELKPGGKEIEITEGNKGEFIELLTGYHLNYKTQHQMDKLLKGFYSLIPNNFVSVLDVDELEFFLCGDFDIDLEDWEANTVYKGDYSESHKVIRWFWTVLSELSESQRRKFLQFCTGSARVPVEGFKGLMSNSGKVCKFCIEQKDYTGTNTAFVVAHTCFNRIELPEYPTLNAMRESMKRMLEDPFCLTFGFEQLFQMSLLKQYFIWKSCIQEVIEYVFCQLSEPRECLRAFGRLFLLLCIPAYAIAQRFSYSKQPTFCLDTFVLCQHSSLPHQSGFPHFYLALLFGKIQGLSQPWARIHLEIFVKLRGCP